MFIRHRSKRCIFLIVLARSCCKVDISENVLSFILLPHLNDQCLTWCEKLQVCGKSIFKSQDYILVLRSSGLQTVALQSHGLTFQRQQESTVFVTEFAK